MNGNRTDGLIGKDLTITVPECLEFSVLEKALTIPVRNSQDMWPRLEAMNLCMQQCGMVRNSCAELIWSRNRNDA